MNKNEKITETEKGLVSVIMPTYNRGYIIQRAIDSVKNQTYKNWELIIIDDGSTDDTEAIVKKNKEKNIRYIAYMPNKGGNHARNIGMAVAKGEYFSFLDTDNVWLPSFLQNRVETMGRENADFVFGKLEFDNGNRKFICNELEDYNELDYNKQRILRELLSVNITIDTNTVCMRRRCWEEIGGFDEKVKRFQDWDYFMRILAYLDINIKVVDNVLVRNYIQRDSISNNSKFFWSQMLCIVEKNIELYIKNPECLHNLIKSWLKTDFSAINRNETELLCSIIEKVYSRSLYRQQIMDLMLYLREREELIKKQYDIIEKQEKIFSNIKKTLTADNIKEYFNRNGYQRIVIYGYGILGKLFYKKLCKEGLNVVAIYDRSYVDEKNKLVKRYTGEMPDNDIVVITAVNCYEEIRCNLLTYGNYNVISLQEIFINTE